jgi:hypothetical protein
MRVRHELLAIPELARKAQRHVVRDAELAEPDIVVNLDESLAFPIVEEIRAIAEAPVVFWYPDSPGRLGREMQVLGRYDAYFFKDSDTVRYYRSILGLNAHFLPEACNPRWHKPEGRPGEGHAEPTVLVAGNLYATRFVLLRELIRRGIGVELYGPPPPRWLPTEPRLARTRGYLAHQEKARAFRAAPIVLNSLASHEGDGLNCRLFEAAGCGAVVLTEWRARLPDFFEEPAEVSSYRTFDELVAQVKSLCKLDADARGRLGEAAASRAHGEHTYLHRFDSILSSLG